MGIKTALANWLAQRRLCPQRLTHRVVLLRGDGIQFPQNPDVIALKSKVAVQSRDEVFVGYVTRVQRVLRDGLYYMTFHVAEYLPRGDGLDDAWSEVMDKDIGDVLGGEPHPE